MFYVSDEGAEGARVGQSGGIAQELQELGTLL
jgi:hypothetical protein